MQDEDTIRRLMAGVTPPKSTEGSQSTARQEQAVQPVDYEIPQTHPSELAGRAMGYEDDA